MKKSELRKLIKEEISKVLKEDANDGSQHHIDQIDLDNIIKGIEGLKIQQKQVFQDMENDN